MEEKMSARDYDIYKSAIDVANDNKDKDALREIQKQLVVRYGMENDDVRYLLKRFRYSV